MADTSVIYDKITDLLDAVQKNPDPVERLALLHYAAGVVRPRIDAARSKAAFDARCEHTLDHIIAVTGISKHSLREWCQEYRERTGDERTYHVHRYDFTGAHELTPPMLVGNR